MSMTHPPLPDWANRYLAHLGLEQEAPTYEFLEKICVAHLNRLAFENISKLLYYRDREQNGFFIPPIELFVENMIRHDFGGTCYTNNSRGLLLLRELGYDVEHVHLHPDHLGILVRLPVFPGERLYVDWGSAAPLFRPVRFQTDAANSAAFSVDAIRILPDAEQAGHYRYTRYRRGELVSNDWIFNPDEPIEFEALTDIINGSNEPGAFFMKQLRCMLFQLDRQRYVSLVNNVLTIRTADGGQKQRVLQSVEEIEQAMTDEFRLPKLPVREAVEVLAGLGVDVFAEKE
jgi:N-hydroxyarylamine O-acetyltransferase